MLRNAACMRALGSRPAATKQPSPVTQPSPALPARPVRSVVVHFKEENQDAQSPRSAVEGVIRKQEANLQDAKEAVGSAVEDVRLKVVDGVQDASNISNPQYDSQVQVNPALPAFTRRREIFAGRIAMVGFTAACLWETFLPSHPNVIQQITHIGQLGGLSISPFWATATLAVLVGYDLLALIPSPLNPTFRQDNQEDVAKRPQNSGKATSAGNFQSLLGIRGWGFTKANELFNGRLAMIGFTLAVLNQFRMGGYEGYGPIAQVAGAFGVPVDDMLYASLPTFYIGAVVVAIAGAYITGNTGTKVGEEDIY